MKKRIIRNLTPGQLADPTVMHIRLSDGAAQLHHVEDHPEFDVTCYPHTPDADYSVTLPDGYRADSWWVDDDDPKRDEHSDLMFAIGLCLNAYLIRYHDGKEDMSGWERVFPESARLMREEDERHEAERQKAIAERKARHTQDVERPVTVTVKEPRD